MADKFDTYREALVMETDTVWPAEYADLPAGEKSRIEAELHAKPDQCGDITYIRTHSGFCRTITVTAADVQRLGS